MKTTRKDDSVFDESDAGDRRFWNCAMAICIVLAVLVLVLFFRSNINYNYNAPSTAERAVVTPNYDGGTP